jgi:hypothetical protein
MNGYDDLEGQFAYETLPRYGLRVAPKYTESSAVTALYRLALT